MMQRTILALLVVFTLAWPSLAQTVRPQVATTIQTTDTTANSALIGCAINSTTCTGGIKAGKASLAQGLALSGATIDDAGIVIASAVPSGTTAFTLYNNAGTLTWNGAPLAAGSSVSGTQYTIAFFTGATTVGDSIITQNAGATIVTVTGTFNSTVAYQLNGTDVTTAGTLANFAYLDASNVFTSASGQKFTGGISVSAGTQSTHGIMIPDAVPAVATTNLHNASGVLTWDGGGAFTTLNTGQGANELYAMDQAVLAASAVTFATVNTGQGAYELYAMDQDVLTTSSPTFVTVAANLTGNVTGNTSGSAGTVTSISGHASTELSDTAALAYLAGVQTFSGAKTFSADVTLSGAAANIILGSNFLSGDGGDEGVSVAADGVVSFSGAFTERGRSTAAGEWATQAYAAGDYTAASGTWTVEAGDVTTNRYSLVGKTVTWQIVLVTTTVSATPDDLRIAIPGSLTEASVARGGSCGTTHDSAVAITSGWATTAAPAGYVIITRLDGTNWSAATNTTAINCTIIFEIA